MNIDRKILNKIIQEKRHFENSIPLHDKSMKQTDERRELPYSDKGHL
jgi:hypothetical protein